jgi:TonB family protein
VSVRDDSVSPVAACRYLAAFAVRHLCGTYAALTSWRRTCNSAAMRPSAATCSAALHGVAVLGVICLYRADIARLRPVTMQPRLAITIWNRPYRASPDAGGGQRESAPASLGRLPPRMAPNPLRPFTPPTAHILNEHPKLPVQQVLLIDPGIPLPDVALDRIGSPFGVNGPLSGGTGGPGGIGNGGRGGIGDGDGAGLQGSPASVPYLSSEPTRPPALLHKVEPEYSEDARKAKVQGSVWLTAEVDANGRLRNIQVTRTLGLGLDEKAVEAARLWRFRPAYRGGRPVAHGVSIEVNFRLL